MSNKIAQNIIYADKVIMVEGRDDKFLLEKWVNDASCNIVDMKRYGNLSSRLEDVAKQTKRFQAEITHLLIIVDADDNFATRKQDVLNKLKDIGIPLSNRYQLGTIEEVNNIKVGIYILPDNSIGSLETLLLQSVNHDKLLDCAEKMIECCKTKEPTFECSTQNKYDKIKLRLHMNLLVVDHDFSYDKTFVSEINYDHDCFESLKQFITY